MNIIEKLKQAQAELTYCKSEIECVESLRLAVQRVTACYDTEVVDGTKDPHRREELLCKMIDLQHKVETRLSEVVGNRETVVAELESLNISEKAKAALNFHFLLGFSVSKTALALGVSDRQVFRWFRKVGA